MIAKLLFKFIAVPLLLISPIMGLAQDRLIKTILEDGTVVKRSTEGNIELNFPSDKQIHEAHITNTGDIKTKYSQATSITSPSEKEASIQSMPIPDVNFFSVNPNQLDENSRKSFINARTEYFAYFSTGYQHRQQVFYWQLLSSKIIFVVVVILVFSGICRYTILCRVKKN